MKRFILLPLLAAVSQVEATPISVEMTGTMGPFYSQNSRFFPDANESGGQFRLYLEVDADISMTERVSYEGPDIGMVSTARYDASGTASTAILELNGVLMDLNQYSSAGLGVNFRLSDNICPTWPACQGVTKDEFAVFFGAFDYQNDDLFQLVNGALTGTLRSVFDNSTFDGLNSTYTEENGFHPSELVSFRQQFNYQDGSGSVTEFIQGGEYSTLATTRVTVPEPGTLALLSLGLLGLAAFRRGAQA